MASHRREDTTMSQRQDNIPPEETMETDNQVPFDDPQFVKVLETCLKMEIASCKEKLAANSEKVEKMKTTIRNEISRRKRLKENMTLMQKVRVRLTESLTRLHISNSEMTDKLDVMRANADDEYKLMEMRAREYRDIIAEYKNTSDAYHAMYEEFPLAKARKAARIELEKLKIKYMVMTYKKKEMMTIAKQREDIDWIRMRCTIIQFAQVMTERLKLEEKLTRLKVNVDYHTRELRSIEIEVQVRHERLEDQRRLRRQKMMEMAPPKINIRHQQMYAQAQTRTSVPHQWMQAADTFDDTISINTVALEELCINENITMSPEIIDLEPEQNEDPKCAVVETKDSIQKPNSKNPDVYEKMDATRAASVVSDIAAEKAASADNNVEMRETHQEERHQSQKSAKTRASPCTKGNSLKHRAATSTQDEIEAKRVRLQREDYEGSNSNRINVGPSAAVREDNAESHKSPTSGPKIKKIEAVQYNIFTVPKSVPCPSGAGSNIFSSSRYEYCDSNISDQSFMKGPESLYDESLYNYQLSPVFEKKAPNATVTNLLQQDDKNQPQDDKNQPQNNNDRTPLFYFDNFTKKGTDNFSLF